MTYSEAIGYLRSLQVFGLRPGLETTHRLAGDCGDPQNRLQFIHVAGTNGKGSVCAMLEAMHRQAGRRVGLYTSPHLVSFGERIQINRQPIAEADVVRWVELIRGHVENGLQTPTFFEFVTVMALGYFAEQGCDLVLWETGLGGRLDATNIVTPLASVITNIDLEHQQWLGVTHDAIAAEKAGIIKPGRPVITAARPGQGLEVIAATAGRLGCGLTVVDGGWGLPGMSSWGASGAGLGATVVTVAEAWAWGARDVGAKPGAWPSVSLAGRHQRINAAVALATVSALAAEWPVSVEAMRTGLETAQWSGRMQRVRGANGQEFLLDGAHNPASALALREALADVWPAVRPTLILGVLADKEWEPMLRTLVPVASRILTVPVSSQRTLAPEALLEGCRRINPDAAMACSSLVDALVQAEHDPFVVITGSLYLVGEALERLGGLTPTASERALNEWGKGPAR